MKFLVAVSSPEAARLIESMLGQITGDAVVHSVQSLSEAYHLAEHDIPDFAFIGPKLALDPQFSGLNSLLSSLPVSRAILLPTGPRRQDVTRLAQSMGFTTMDAHLGPYVFQRQLMNFKAETAEPSRSNIDDRRLILIGASTGGVDALLQVLASINADSPPVVIVQHTGRGFGDGLVRLLRTACRAEVVPAAEGTILSTGHVYVATDAESHVVIAPGTPSVCRLRVSEKISGHRPSIDVLFQSATHIADKVSAAILTGMGSDGAEGLLALRRAGAATFGQNEATCVVYGMPRVAYEKGAVERQLPPFEIGTALIASCAARKEYHVH